MVRWFAVRADMPEQDGDHNGKPGKHDRADQGHQLQPVNECQVSRVEQGGAEWVGELCGGG